MTRRPRLVLLALCVVALASACERNGGPPRLEVSPAEYVRGVESAPGGDARAGVGARFRIRNGGQGPLQLRALVSDCACHAAIVGPDVVGSNEEVTIAARCRPVPGAGDHRQLRVHSNDPDHPTHTLAVRVAGGDPVARPAALSFGYVQVGREVAREILVPDAPPLVRLKSGADAFSLVPGAVGRDGSRTYRVRFAPQRPGVSRAVLARGAGAVPIAVSGVGFEDLAAFPAEVRTPSAVAEDLPQLFLKNVTGTPLEVTRIDYPPGIAGELQTIVAGEEFRVRLRSVGPPRNVSPGAILVHTNASDAPSVVVPVIHTTAPRA